MLATKMDLLLKKLDDAPKAKVQALDARMTCEHCGNTGHTGDSCPKHTSEDVNFVNNLNSRPNIPFSGQGNSSGNTLSFNKSPFDQKTINDSISKKFLSNDRVLKTLSLQMETLNSAMKKQLSFNKMLETQIA